LSFLSIAFLSILAPDLMMTLLSSKAFTDGDNAIERRTKRNRKECSR